MHWEEPEIYRHRLRNGPAFIIMRKSRWPKASIGQTSAPIRRKGDWRNPKWEIPKIMEINNIRWHWYANDRHHIGSVLKSESCKGSSRFQISRFRSTLNLTLRLASRLWLCKSGGTTAAAFLFRGLKFPDNISRILWRTLRFGKFAKIKLIVRFVRFATISSGILW